MILRIVDMIMRQSTLYPRTLVPSYPCTPYLVVVLAVVVPAIAWLVVVYGLLVEVQRLANSQLGDE